MPSASHLLMLLIPVIAAQNLDLNTNSTESTLILTTDVSREASPNTTTEKSARLQILATQESVNASTPSPTRKPKKIPETECEKNFQISDECLQNALFIGQQKADIPHSIAHMESYCEEKKEKFGCIRQYGSKCLKNVPRQIYLTITKNVKKMFKEFCDTESGKNTFLKHLECVKPEDLMILNQVLGKLTLALEFVARNVTRDKMITYACCALYKTYDEIPSAMGGLCAPRPTPNETMEFFRSLIKRTVGDILDIGCGKFNSFAYCEQNFKSGLTEIHSYVTSGRPLPDNSFMIPLMEFSQKLDGN